MNSIVCGTASQSIGVNNSISPVVSLDTVSTAVYTYYHTPRPGQRAHTINLTGIRGPVAMFYLSSWPT